jgi:hypothetical protein
MSNTKKVKEAYTKTLNSAVPSDRASILVAAVLVVASDFDVVVPPDIVALIVAIVGFAASVVARHKA